MIYAISPELKTFPHTVPILFSLIKLFINFDLFSKLISSHSFQIKPDMS